VIECVIVWPLLDRYPEELRPFGKILTPKKGMGVSGNPRTEQKVA